MSGVFENVLRFFGGGEAVPVTGEGATPKDVKYLAYHKREKNEDRKMAEEQSSMGEDNTSGAGAKPARFLGSLKDALAAAGRDDTGKAAAEDAASASAAIVPPPIQAAASEAVAVVAAAAASVPGVTKSAAEAAREARASTEAPGEQQREEPSSAPTTRVVKAASSPVADDDTPARTQLVRGKKPVERGGFDTDPVVGWLVVVGGPGIGRFRPVFEGNNAIGRGGNQRIALDFGDESISSEEQAFIRYDSSDRSFLFVPNLAKTNVVSVNNKRPTGAVELMQMDVITMGRTQLVFVPFCGSEFDWAELADRA